MDSGNPGARPEPKPDINPKTLPVLTTPAYPKPPRLLHRFLFLCLKPEAWAAAARYPFRVTLVPLLLAIFIASLVSAIGLSGRVSTAFSAFAKIYDANYPQMEINSDGILSVADPARLPLNFNIAGNHIIVDTSGKTTFDSLKDSDVLLITNSTIFHRHMGVDLPEMKIAETLNRTLPSKGTTLTINSASIEKTAEQGRPFIAGFFTLVFLLTNSIWTGFTLLLISPAVSIGAALGKTRLFIPRRPGYRIAAAVLVPIILFSGIIDAAGYSLTSTISPQNNLLVWFFASAALAFWAGILAKHMYLPKPKLKPRRTP